MKQVSKRLRTPHRVQMRPRRRSPRRRSARWRRRFSETTARGDCISRSAARPRSSPDAAPARAPWRRTRLTRRGRRRGWPAPQQELTPPLATADPKSAPAIHLIASLASYSRSRRGEAEDQSRRGYQFRPASTDHAERRCLQEILASSCARSDGHSRGAAQMDKALGRDVPAGTATLRAHLRRGRRQPTGRQWSTARGPGRLCGQKATSAPPSRPRRLRSGAAAQSSREATRRRAGEHGGGPSAFINRLLEPPPQRIELDAEDKPRGGRTGSRGLLRRYGHSLRTFAPRRPWRTRRLPSAKGGRRSIMPRASSTGSGCCAVPTPSMWFLQHQRVCFVPDESKTTRRLEPRQGREGPNDHW